MTAVVNIEEVYYPAMASWQCFNRSWVSKSNKSRVPNTGAEVTCSNRSQGLLLEVWWWWWRWWWCWWWCHNWVP